MMPSRDEPIRQANNAELLDQLPDLGVEPELIIETLAADRR